MSVYIIDFLESICIMWLYWFVLDPLFHEFGHAIMLRKTEGYAAISFYVPIAKKFKINIGGIEVFNVRNKKYKNITYSKSDFIEIEDADNVKIARAGIRNSVILTIIILVFSILVRLAILLLLMIVMLVLFIYARFFDKKYNDFNIAKNPQSFKQRNNQYDIDSCMKYDNLIKEYNK